MRLLGVSVDKGTGLTTLAPPVSRHSPERKAIRLIVSKIIRQISHRYSGDDLLEHIYCAGLWHGSQLAERINRET